MSIAFGNLIMGLVMGFCIGYVVGHYFGMWNECIICKLTSHKWLYVESGIYQCQRCKRLKNEKGDGESC